jgi:dienelactone hydrolase
LKTRADTLAARWARLEPHIQIARPEGDGPWPVLVMFHCGGTRPYLDGYVRAAVGAGVMTVVVDSFAHRSISRVAAIATVCTGAQLQGWKRAGDVLASLWGVRGLAGADPDRIALAGWSHGGWSIMDLMTMPLLRPGEADIADPDPSLLKAVKALFLAYPYCGPGALSQLRSWRHAPDHAYAFVGLSDMVAHPPLCRRAFRQVERAGVRLQTWFPPGASHAFDEDGVDIGGVLGVFRHDPDLSREAERRLAGYLTDVFAPATRGNP